MGNIGGPPNAAKGQGIPIDFTKIRSLQAQNNTVLVNIMGHQVGPDFYGVGTRFALNHTF